MISYLTRVRFEPIYHRLYGAFKQVMTTSRQVMTSGDWRARYSGIGLNKLVTMFTETGWAWVTRQEVGGIIMQTINLLLYHYIYVLLTNPDLVRNDYTQLSLKFIRCPFCIAGLLATVFGSSGIEIYPLHVIAGFVETGLFYLKNVEGKLIILILSI